MDCLTHFLRSLCLEVRLGHLLTFVVTVVRETIDLVLRIHAVIEALLVGARRECLALLIVVRLLLVLAMVHPAS